MDETDSLNHTYLGFNHWGKHIPNVFTIECLNKGTFEEV